MLTVHPLSPAELVTTRESLGLTSVWLAAYVGSSPRTGRRWEAGETEIPIRVSAAVAALHAHAVAVAEDLTVTARATPGTGILLHRDDQAYQQDCEYGVAYPARWHRAVVARAALTAPCVPVAFAGEQDPSRPWKTFVFARPAPPDEVPYLLKTDDDNLIDWLLHELPAAFDGYKLALPAPGGVLIHGRGMEKLRQLRPDDDGHITDDADGVHLWAEGLGHLLLPQWEPV